MRVKPPYGETYVAVFLCAEGVMKSDAPQGTAKRRTLSENSGSVYGDAAERV